MTHECDDCHHVWDEPDEIVYEGDWAPISLTETASKIRSGEYAPITPEVLMVIGTIALFYKARINSIFGESGGGKTWVALAAIVEVVRNGMRALMIDYEDNPAGIAERLVLLGLTDDEIDLVDYRNPTAGIGLGLTFIDPEIEYELVVIDSTGEAMAAGAVDSNADREVAQWFALVKHLSRLPGSPAVIVLDHVPKDKEAPSSYAIGSQRKRAAVTGAAYRVDTLKEPAKGRDGRLKLTVAKDRPGNRAKGTTAAEVAVLSAPGSVTIELHQSEAQAATQAGEKFRPTVLMEKVSRFLESVPGASGRTIEKMVPGKGTGIRSAIECLVAEEYVRVGQHGYESAEPYRAPVDIAQARPASQARPQRVPDAAGGGASPRPLHSIAGDAGRASGGLDMAVGAEGASPVDNDDSGLW